MFILFFFFFSSRRRHTRYWRDWSSDVCSSDLVDADLAGIGFYEADAGEIRINGKRTRIRSSKDAIASGIGMVHQHFMLVRSEERRVGKECRSRWSPYH